MQIIQMMKVAFRYISVNQRYIYISFRGNSSECFILIQIINAMNKISMISHQVRQPILQIKILTIFQPLGFKEPIDSAKLAQIYLYSSASVYKGDLIKRNINKQLAWNQQSLNTIYDSLNGVRSNIEIKFHDQTGKFSLICEIQTGINIQLFWIQFERVNDINPTDHMKKIFMEFRKGYNEQQAKVKQEKQRINNEIKQIQALEKQIQQQTITEIAHMKKNFVYVINNCKKQLRKYMKTGISEIINEDDEAEETMSKKRTIVRVNLEALQKQEPNINNQIIDYHSNIGENQDLDSIFD